jgi:hypothetical protein
VAAGAGAPGDPDPKTAGYLPKIALQAGCRLTRLASRRRCCARGPARTRAKEVRA